MPKQTNHPSPEELSAYSLGQLPPDDADVIESHIGECQPCCETMLGLSSEDTFVALLQEAKQLPTDQTLAQDSLPAKPSSSLHDIPAPLSEHLRYEILGLIGKGGMGAVYKARHRMMERTVALKVINRDLVRRPEAVERFHREVKTAAQMSHPNIVTAYDAEQAGDVHFLVMEYVEGVDLSHTVKDRGALPIDEACDYIRQAAIGLQYAHERGMVHRDIKPHNLMVTADGTVKILDFGLASLAPEALSDADTVEARGDLTAAGAIMGTPDFISPEQAENAHQADIRSDIYSLGTTLYFLLSGRPPFADGSVMHKLKSHAQAEPEPLDMLRDDVAVELADTVTRMTAKNPADRFQSPAEVAAALTPFSKPDTETAPAPVKRSRRRRTITTVCAAAILSLLAGVIFVVTDKGTLEIKSELDALSPDEPKVASARAPSDESLETPLESEMHAVMRQLQDGPVTASDQLLVEQRLDEIRAKRAEARRQTSANNLHQLGLGFHRFHETHRHLPSSQGGQIVFFDGTAFRSKPTQPFSWRVALLPFIGHAELYQQYHFDEPWDSDNNLKLLEKMPAVYRYPQSGGGSTTTCYVAMVGQGTALEASNNVKFSQIVDGTANTLLLVEAKTAIPWTKPEDLEYSSDQPLPSIGSFDASGVNVLLADGHIRFLKHPVDDKLIRALVSRDGMERTEKQKSQEVEDSVAPEIAALLAEPSDSAPIDQIAELLDAWKRLPDQSEESDVFAKKISTIHNELHKQQTPNTEKSRQTSARLALIAWPFLADSIPKPMAQTLADLTKPDAAIRVSERLAEANRPTEPLGWDVQAAHALALARAGKTEEALKENEALMKKIDVNVRKGRLPELQLEFLGTTRSQKSLLKQTLLQKSLILAIAGRTAESVDASTAAGQVEVNNPAQDDHSAIQSMLRVLAKAIEPLDTETTHAEDLSDDRGQVSEDDDIGNREREADREASAPRIVLDQGYTIIDAGATIGSRRLVVTEKAQTLSIVEEYSLALKWDGAPLGIVERDYSTDYSLAGDTPLVLIGTSSTKEQGSLVMQGAVEFKNGEALTSWTSYTERGHKLETPKKQQAAVEPPPGALVLGHTIQVVGPLLLPEDGERRIVWGNFDDHTPEGKPLIEYEAGCKLRRASRPEGAGFTITLFTTDSKKPKMTLEYDAKGECESIRQGSTTVMKPHE